MSMRGPAVSICIPAYKQEAHLRRLLSSIAEQTWTDREVILTDDSPDDRIERLVNELRDIIPGIKYMRNNPALGTPRNWNHAMDQATGTWIKVMHHDDWFTRPDALERFMRKAIEGDLDLVCSAALAVNERTGTNTPHQPSEEEIAILFAAPHRLLFGNRIGPPSSVLHRRSLGIHFREDHKYLVDLEFYAAVLMRTERAAYIPEPLIGSISGAAHNVTNTCFTREVELKENLEAYQAWAHMFTAAGDARRLAGHFGNLFIRYDIRGPHDLKVLVPGIRMDRVLENALSRARRSRLLRIVKRRLAGTALYRVLRGAKRDAGKVSHAQCGEDLIMEHVLTNLGIRRPFYVDIGAHDPFHLNNTAIFHQQGARGVNIEPDPTLIERFRKKRPGDVNLGIGVSDRPDASKLSFHVFNVPTLNTFSAEEARRIEQEDPRYKVVRVIDVPVRNINDVLDEHCGHRRIDILSMDVEGLDEALIRAIDLDRHRPLLICLETISFSSTGQGVKNQPLIDLIKGKGYLLYADTNINSIFVLEHIWKR
jgi:FkbM family methyltransferase